MSFAVEGVLVSDGAGTVRNVDASFFDVEVLDFSVVCSLTELAVCVTGFADDSCNVDAEVIGVVRKVVAKGDTTNLEVVS